MFFLKRKEKNKIIEQLQGYMQIHNLNIYCWAKFVDIFIGGLNLDDDVVVSVSKKIKEKNTTFIQSSNFITHMQAPKNISIELKT
jgi:hypothetical protein